MLKSVTVMFLRNHTEGGVHMGCMPFVFWLHNIHIKSCFKIYQTGNKIEVEYYYVVAVDQNDQFLAQCCALLSKKPCVCFIGLIVLNVFLVIEENIVQIIWFSQALFLP